MDTVLNWVWQGGVVAAVSLVMLFVLQRAGANVRSAVCWAALLLIVALPALPPLSSATPAASAFLPMPSDAVVSLPDTWWTSTLALLVAWMVWASVQLVRLGTAMVAIRRARARSHRFPPHLESALFHWGRIRSQGRRATLVLSNSVTSAAVLGWGAPMIAVAPSLVRALEPDDLDRVLIHEWAHIQRRDDVVNVFQVAVRILAGWHPALWSIDRRLSLEREIACDEVTVAITGSPKSYAECLLKLSARRGTPPPLQTAPAIFTPSGLRARVVKIVSPPPCIARPWSATLAALTIVLLCLASLAVGGLTLVEATAFAQPLASARTFARNLSSYSQAPFTVDTRTAAAPRRAPARVSPQNPTMEEPAGVTPRAPEPAPAAAANEPPAVSASRAAPVAAVPVVRITTELPSLTPTVPAPQVAADAARSVWSAASGSGVAIGRKSKDAGVATAGFFSRAARRVAGSF